MRTFIYVDGFNLYYGALKNTAYKWLDLNNLFHRILLSYNEIHKIKYFTARIKSQKTGDYRPVRLCLLGDSGRAGFNKQGFSARQMDFLNLCLAGHLPAFGPGSTGPLPGQIARAGLGLLQRFFAV